MDDVVILDAIFSFFLFPSHLLYNPCKKLSWWFFFFFTQFRQIENLSKTTFFLPDPIFMLNKRRKSFQKHSIFSFLSIFLSFLCNKQRVKRWIMPLFQVQSSHFFMFPSHLLYHPCNKLSCYFFFSNLGGLRFQARPFPPFLVLFYVYQGEEMLLKRAIFLFLSLSRITHNSRDG